MFVSKSTGALPPASLRGDFPSSISFNDDAVMVSQHLKDGLLHVRFDIEYVIRNITSLMESKSPGGINKEGALNTLLAQVNFGQMC
jgi:hypothetical protein